LSISYNRARRRRLDSSSKIGEEEQSKEKIYDPEEEKRREAERVLQQRFKTFELYFKEIAQLFDLWDRTQGTIYRQPSASDRSEHDDHLANKRTSRKNERRKLSLLFKSYCFSFSLIEFLSSKKKTKKKLKKKKMKK
jgi:hypothetical protein